MANPCAIFIDDPKLAKKLGVEVGKRLTYAEFAEKVNEGLLDDIADIGGGEPPINETPKFENPFSNYSPNETGIQNMVTTLERIQQGKEPIEIKGEDKRSWKQVMKNAENWFRQGNNSVEGLLAKITNGSAPTAEEIAVMTMHKVDLDNKMSDALERKSKMIESNDPMYLAVQAEINDLNAKYERYYEAARRSGYEQGLAFNIRKMMLKNDYSIGTILKRLKANGETKVPTSTINEAEDLVVQHDAAIKEIERLTERHEKELAQAVLDAIKSTKEEMAKEAKTPRKQSEKAKTLADKIRKAKISDDIMLSSVPFGKQAFNGALEAAAKAIEAGGKIADAITAAIEHIRGTQDYNNLQDQNLKDKVEEKLREYLKEEPETKGSISIKDDKLNITKGYLESLVENGYDTIDAMTSYIKETEEGKDFSEREIRDAISGYGKTNYPSASEIDKLISIAKGEGRLMSGLEDVTGGKRPQRTGFQRRKLTDKERALTQEINQKNKQIPEDAEESAKGWATALDRTKTALKNRITDLTNAIETNTKIFRDKKLLELDDETKNLQIKKDALQKEYDAIFKEDNKLSDFEKAQRLEQYYEKQVEQLQTDLDNFDIAIKVKEKLSPTPKMTALKNQLEDLKEMRKLMREQNGMAYANDVKIREKRNEKRIKDLERKREEIKNGTLKSPIKKASPTSNLIESQQATISHIQNQIETLISVNERKNRSKLEKIATGTSEVFRAMVLSGAATIEKLQGYGILESHFMQPLANLTIGQAIRKIPYLKNINEVAGAQRVADPKTEIKRYAKSIAKYWAKDTFADTKNVVKTGKSQLDLLWGEHKITHPEIGAWVGHVHKALKNQTLNALFVKHLESNLYHQEQVLGENISDPKIVTLASRAALIDAYNDILLGKNWLSTQWNGWISQLETAGKNDSGLRNAGIVGANFMRILEPVTGVPTNYANRLLSYHPVFGGTKALIKIASAKAQGRGASELTKEEATSIIRNIKSAGLGSIGYALGYLLPNLFGGVSDDDELKNKKGLKKDEFAFMPKAAGHHMFWESVQLGATTKRVDEKESDEFWSKTAEVTAKMEMEYIKNTPFLDLPETILKADNADRASKTMGGIVRNLTTPMFVQQLSKYLDKDADGNEIKRKTDGILDELKSGIYPLRIELPNRESYQAKNKISTEDLANPKVTEFKKSETFKDIPASYQEEAIARYAKEVKRIEGYKDITPKDKDKEYKQAKEKVSDAIKSQAKEDKFISEAKTLKGDELVEKLRKKFIYKVSETSNAYKDYSQRQSQYNEWEKKGILTPEVKKQIEKIINSKAK